MVMIANANVTANWSTAVLLTQPERWQVRGGPIVITDDPNPGTDDGIMLKDRETIELAVGQSVRFKLFSGVKSNIIRMGNPEEGYVAAFDHLVVGNGRDLFRDEFFSLDPAVWETIQTGSGMAVTVAGAANGARYLNINTGTTNNAETIIQTKQTFQLPAKLVFGLSMSQRIANQEAFVELVSVNSAGVVETDATFPSTNLNNASNAASIKFDGTTATNAIYITRGDGISELASGSVAFLTTAATGSGPNFIPASIFEINGDMEEVFFAARPIDSLAAGAVGFKRTQLLPNTSKQYKIRLRVRNLTGAGSATDVRFHFMRLLDAARLTVDMARHMGRSTDIGDSIPVLMTNTPAVTISGTPSVNATLQTGANNVGRVGLDAPAVAGGVATVGRLLSAAASTNATNLKATAGRVFKIIGYNAAAAIRFLKIYNKATAPTVGTDTPVMTIPLKPTSDFQIDLGDIGLSLSAGIGYALTVNGADADATALTAADIVGMNILYA